MRFISLVTLCLLASCATKPDSYVVLMPNADGTTGKIIVSNQKNAKVEIDQPGYGTQFEDAKGEVKEVKKDKLALDFKGATEITPPLPKTFLLYFKTGGAVLTKESEALIPEILHEVEARQVPDISIIGHTDTVGKADLNEAVALKRAKAIATMIQEAGLKTKEVTIDSHGERNLLVKTPDETAEEKNRRVEITVR